MRYLLPLALTAVFGCSRGLDDLVQPPARTDGGASSSTGGGNGAGGSGEPPPSGDPLCGSYRAKGAWLRLPDTSSYALVHGEAVDCSQLSTLSYRKSTAVWFDDAQRLVWPYSVAGHSSDALYAIEPGLGYAFSARRLRANSFGASTCETACDAPVGDAPLPRRWMDGAAVVRNVTLDMGTGPETHGEVALWAALRQSGACDDDEPALWAMVPSADGVVWHLVGRGPSWPASSMAFGEALSATHLDGLRSAVFFVSQGAFVIDLDDVYAVPQPIASGSLPSAIRSVVRFSPAQRMLVEAGGGHLRSWTVSKDGAGVHIAPHMSADEGAFAGCEAIAAAERPGMAYDDTREQMVAWRGDATAYVIDPSAGTCTALVVDGSAPSPSSLIECDGCVLGRFRYAPGLRGFIALGLDPLDSAHLLCLPEP